MKPSFEPVHKIAVSKEAAGFKRAAEQYVKKATASAKAANTTLRHIGIYDTKGALKKSYRG